MAKSIENDEKKYYSYIMVNKNRRYSVLTACVILFVFFYTMVLSVANNPQNWFIIFLPICGIGLLALFIPNVEEWHYAPWQSSPRKYEQQFVD